MLGGEINDEEVEAEQSVELQAGRLQNRGQRDLRAATIAMSQAEKLLTGANTADALVAERAAVTALQRAFSRDRYILRALATRSQLDPARRLTGSLTDATDWHRVPARRSSQPPRRAATGPPGRVGVDLDFLVSVTHVTETRKSRSDPRVLAAEAIRIDPASALLRQAAGDLQRAADGDRRRCTIEGAGFGGGGDCRRGPPRRSAVAERTAAGRALAVGCLCRGTEASSMTRLLRLSRSQSRSPGPSIPRSPCRARRGRASPSSPWTLRRATAPRSARASRVIFQRATRWCPRHRRCRSGGCRSAIAIPARSFRGRAWVPRSPAVCWSPRSTRPASTDGERIVRIDAPREVPPATAIHLDADIEARGMTGRTTDATATIGGLEVGRVSHRGHAGSDRWRASLDAVPVGDPPYVVRHSNAGRTRRRRGRRLAPRRRSASSSTIRVRRGRRPSCRRALEADARFQVASLSSRRAVSRRRPAGRLPLGDPRLDALRRRRRWRPRSPVRGGRAGLERFMRERGGAVVVVPDQRIDAGPARDLISAELAERLLEQPATLAVAPARRIAPGVGTACASRVAAGGRRVARVPGGISPGHRVDAARRRTSAALGRDGRVAFPRRRQRRVRSLLAVDDRRPGARGAAADRDRRRSAAAPARSARHRDRATQLKRVCETVQRFISTASRFVSCPPQGPGVYRSGIRIEAGAGTIDD